MKQLYTYALVTALYDSGEDYVDAFWPLLISCFTKETDIFTILELQNRVKVKYCLEIPVHALRTILNRAKDKGYLDIIDIQKRRPEQQYRLTTKGTTYLSRREKTEDVDRRLEDLFHSMIDFIEENIRKRLSISESQEYLYRFIKENLELVTYYLSSEVNGQGGIPTKLESDLDQTIISYIRSIETGHPSLYNTLLDIVRGSCITVVLQFDDFSKVAMKFKHLSIYLDSNYLFSLMEFHPREYSQPAQELFRILKQLKFDLSVFSITVDEMARVIKSYPENMDFYFPEIEVDTIYYQLKKKGWAKSTAMEFIATLDSRITELGINIVNLPYIDVRSYEPSNLELRIQTYKENRPTASINHDIIIIDRIRKIRGSQKRKIEDAKAIFLTSDMALSRYNYIEFGHRENGTVCEVIPDQLLTTILWLKNPIGMSDIQIKYLIAAHSRNLFINKRVWDRFFKTAKRLRLEGKIGDEDLSALFYGGYIGNVLRDYDENALETIDENFVIEEAKHASDAISAAMAEKDIELINRSVQLVSETKESINQSWFQRIEDEKNRIRKETDDTAQRWSWIITGIGTLLIIGLLGFLWYFNYRTVSALAIIAAIAGGGLLAIWKYAFKKIKAKIHDKAMGKKTANLMRLTEQDLSNE